jgi:ankyrin repeat protein
VVDAYGCMPLHTLCQEVNAEDAMHAILSLTRTILAKGCPLDALDHNGATALHHCVINDLPELAEFLLIHGANPNALTPVTRVSPLAIAALEKNLLLAGLLLRHGADPYLKTNRGQSPASMHPGILHLPHGAAVHIKAKRVGLHRA